MSSRIGGPGPKQPFLGGGSGIRSTVKSVLARFSPLKSRRRSSESSTSSRLSQSSRLSESIAPESSESSNVPDSLTMHILTGKQEEAAEKSLGESGRLLEDPTQHVDNEVTPTLSEKIAHFKEAVTNIWNKYFGSKLDEKFEVQSEKFWGERTNKADKFRACIRSLHNTKELLDRNKLPSFIKEYAEQQVDNILKEPAYQNEDRQQLTESFTNEICNKLEEIAADISIEHPNDHEAVTATFESAAANFMKDGLSAIRSKVLKEPEESSPLGKDSSVAVKNLKEEMDSSSQVSFAKSAENYFSELKPGEEPHIDPDNPPAFIKEYAEARVTSELEGATQHFRHEIQEESGFIRGLYNAVKKGDSLKNYKSDVKKQLIESYTKQLCSELEKASKEFRSGDGPADAAKKIESEALPKLSIAGSFKEIAGAREKDVAGIPVDKTAAERDGWMISFLSYKEDHGTMLRLAQKKPEELSLEEACHFIDMLSEHMENMEAMDATSADIKTIKENSEKVALALLDQSENEIAELEDSEKSGEVEHDKMLEDARKKLVFYGNKIMRLGLEKDSPIKLTHELTLAITKAKEWEIEADTDMQGQVKNFLDLLASSENTKFKVDDLPPIVQQHIEDHVERQMEGTGKFLRSVKEKQSKLGVIGMASQAHHINAYKKQIKKEIIAAYKQQVLKNLLEAANEKNQGNASKAQELVEKSLHSVSVAATMERITAEKATDESDIRPKDKKVINFLRVKEAQVRFQAIAQSKDADITEGQAKDYIDNITKHLKLMEACNYSKADIESMRKSYEKISKVYIQRLTEIINNEENSQVLNLKISTLQAFIADLRQEMAKCAKGQSQLFSDPKALDLDFTNAKGAISTAQKRGLAATKQKRTDFDNRHTKYLGLVDAKTDDIRVEDAEALMKGLTTHVSQMGTYNTGKMEVEAIKLASPKVALALVANRKAALTAATTEEANGRVTELVKTKVQVTELKTTMEAFRDDVVLKPVTTLQSAIKKVEEEIERAPKELEKARKDLDAKMKELEVETHKNTAPRDEEPQKIKDEILGLQKRILEIEQRVAAGPENQRKLEAHKKELVNAEVPLKKMNEDLAKLASALSDIDTLVEKALPKKS